MSGQSSTVKQWPGRDRDRDMMLLAHAFVDNLTRDDCEYGGWGVDSKRPFGNSDVEADIIKIIYLEVRKCPSCGEPLSDECADNPRQYARGLYNDLGPWVAKMWHKAYGTEA
jgi:hypothetical protein